MTTTQKDILHTNTMPVIALRGLTIFPNVLIHFDVARDISIKSLETAMTTGRGGADWNKRPDRSPNALHLRALSAVYGAGP